MSRLVDDILLVIRLDTGRTAEEYGLFAHLCEYPGALLDQIVETHQESASKQGVLLELRTIDSLPPTVLCETLFADALIRLVDNAIKFSRGDERRIVIEARGDYDELRISVHDNGVGIAADAIPSLFQRFGQIARVKREQQGLGLGLAIAKELVTLHGGSITVKSTLNVGSTFTVHIPVASKTEQDMHARSTD